MTLPQRDFDKDALEWDAKPGRIKLAREIATSIIQESTPHADMEVLDFGCGTGLVTLELQPLVKTITGADSSLGMLHVLEEKIKANNITNVVTQHLDLEKGGSLAGEFDLIISSMTLHHVPNIENLFQLCFDHLRPDGRIAFADLDTEDGSFHSDNTGVYHSGFDRQLLKQLLHRIGFHEVKDKVATTTIKEVANQKIKEFSIFLITARKSH